MNYGHQVTDFVQANEIRNADDYQNEICQYFGLRLLEIDSKD